MRRRVRKVQVADLTPILSIHSDRQTRQILAPAARRAPNIKVLDQKNEADQNANKRSSSYEPPSPPHASPVLEEAEWVLDEGLKATVA